jgi:hypothetical protein
MPGLTRRSPVSDEGGRSKVRRLRTAKPCGPGTRCWCQADGGKACPTGSGQAFNPSATVTRRIRRRGEHGISRQTIARGMPDCSDCTCMLVCVFRASFAHETAGAASTRHSLRPLLFGRTTLENLGRIAPRDRGGAFSGNHDVIASAAKQSIVTSHTDRWIASLCSQ